MRQGTEHPRTLFVSGIGGSTRRYRCFHQREQLRLLGVETGFRESDDAQLLADALAYDIFVLHRVPYSDLIGVVIDVAHLRGKPVIFDTDDLVFAPEVYGHIGFIDTLSPEDAREFRDDLERQAETFRRCECVLATTSFLAEEAQRRGKPAYVNRNAASNDMVRISELAFAERREQRKESKEEDRPLVAAYLSGTDSHNRDFRVITEPLLAVMDNHPNLWLHIGGHLELGPEFSQYQSRIRRVPYVTWQELPYFTAQADINLAPLEQANPFCRAKSENRFVEAALVGVPTIASRVEALEYAITDGENGLLAGTREEWRAALETLASDAGTRRTIGEEARRTAYARYVPEQRAPELLDTLERIFAAHAGQAVTQDELVQEWASRMKDYADNMQETAAEQEARLKSLRLALRHYEDQLAEKDRLIADMADGRVMRLLTAIQRLFRRLLGKEAARFGNQRALE